MSKRMGILERLKGVADDIGTKASSFVDGIKTKVNSVKEKIVGSVSSDTKRDLSDIWEAIKKNTKMQTRDGQNGDGGSNLDSMLIMSAVSSAMLTLLGGAAIGAGITGTVILGGAVVGTVVGSALLLAGEPIYNHRRIQKIVAPKKHVIKNMVEGYLHEKKVARGEADKRIFTPELIKRAVVRVEIMREKASDIGLDIEKLANEYDEVNKSMGPVEAYRVLDNTRYVVGLNNPKLLVFLEKAVKNNGGLSRENWHGTEAEIATKLKVKESGASEPKM